MTHSPRYLHGDSVTVPAEIVTDAGNHYVVLESPCCGARAWWPVSSLIHDHANGWPSYVRCGRAHGVLSAGPGLGHGCDWRWRVTITTDGGVPVDMTWTA